MRRGGASLAGAFAASLACAGLAGGCPPRKPVAADRVFLGGRVWTGDPARPTAEALAVCGSTLLAVGSDAEVRWLAGKGTETVDLRGRFVVPGFVDARLHLLGGGLALDELRLEGAETLAALTDRVRGWARAQPTRAQLDLAVPERPAWLVSYDGHTGRANSFALRAAGVTRETKDPPGGTIVRDASGEATGLLKESAQELVERLLPKPLPYEKEQALARALAQAAACGLTSVQGDPTPGTLARQDVVRRRFASGRLRVGAVKGSPPPSAPPPPTARAAGATAWSTSRCRSSSTCRASRPGGIVASTQATFPYPDANHLRAYLPTLGPERARRALAFRSIDEAGAVQAFGSDWPVLEADALRAMACAVTRTTLGGSPAGGWEPSRRLSAEAVVVLSQDLLAIAPERIQGTKVLLTVLGGQDTFRAPEV